MYHFRDDILCKKFFPCNEWTNSKQYLLYSKRMLAKGSAIDVNNILDVFDYVATIQRLNTKTGYLPTLMFNLVPIFSFP